MLDAFGVALGDAGGDAQGAEKGDDELVALAAATGEALAGSGEEDGAIGLGVHELFALETGDRADDGDMADAHDLGEINDAGLALRGDEHGDGFNVVFGEFARVRGADGCVRGRASRDGRARRRTSARRARHRGIIATGRGCSSVVDATLCSRRVTL